MKLKIDSLLGRLAELRDVSSNTSTLGRLLTNVGRTIRNVVAQCSLLTNSSESELSQLCNEMSSHEGRYIPHISESMVEFGGEGSSLKKLRKLVNDLSFSQTETNDTNEFEKYLEDLVSAKVINKRLLYVL